MKLGARAAGNGNPAADGPLEGPGIDAFLNIGVRLESVAAEIAAHNRKKEKLWASLHQVPLTGPALMAAGDMIDEPNLTGPRTGWFWDLRRLSFAPADRLQPWTGTIWVYDSPGGELLDRFTPDRLIADYGKGQRLLHPHQRLVYIAGDDFGGGPALIGGEADQATDDCLPAYLN
jgi:hypothetical protein